MDDNDFWNNTMLNFPMPRLLSWFGLVILWKRKQNSLDLSLSCLIFLHLTEENKERFGVSHVREATKLSP
jgi:hypothetical protein